MSDQLLVPRSRLGPLTPLGRGGTATVYRAPRASVPGLPDLVYKEYKASIRASAGPGLLPGLRGLVAFHQRLDPALVRIWDERVVWPLRVVVDDADPHAAVGVLMRLIPSRYFQRVVSRMTGSVTTVAREVETLFGSNADMTRIGYPAMDLRRRLAVIARIADVYGILHKQEVVVGDISGRNVVYDVSAPAASVMILDADSCRIARSRAAFDNQPQTPLWEPPEAVRAVRLLAAARRAGQKLTTAESAKLSNTAQNQSYATDIYKFGLMVVRILDSGRRRAVNYDPTKAAQTLRRHVGAHAEQLLLLSLSNNHNERPTIRQWYDALNGPPSARQPQRPGSRLVYVSGKGWVRQP